MVSQKLISFKIDEENLVKLDKICKETGTNRNKFLNFLVEYGISNMKYLAEFNLILSYQQGLKEISF